MNTADLLMLLLDIKAIYFALPCYFKPYVNNVSTFRSTFIEVPTRRPEQFGVLGRGPDLQGKGQYDPSLHPSRGQV